MPKENQQVLYERQSDRSTDYTNKSKTTNHVMMHSKDPSNNQQQLHGHLRGISENKVLSTHSKDFSGYQRDALNYSKDIPGNQRDTSIHSRTIGWRHGDSSSVSAELLAHSRDAKGYLRNAASTAKDIPSHSRDTSGHFKDKLNYSRETFVHSKELSGHSNETQNISRETQNNSRETQNHFRETQNRFRETQSHFKETQGQSRDRQNQFKETQGQSRDTQSQFKDTQSQSRDTQSQSREIQSQSRDTQSQSRDTQSQSRDTQSQSRDTQSQSRDTQSQSRDTQSQSRDTQSQSRDAQSQSRDAQSQSRDTQSHLRDPHTCSKDMFLQSRDISSFPRNISYHSRSTSLHSKDVADNLKDTIVHSKHLVNHSRDLVNQSRDLVSQSRDLVNQTNDTCQLNKSKSMKSYSKDLVGYLRNIVSHSRDIINNSRNTSTNSKNISNSSHDTSSNDRDSCVLKRNVSNHSQDISDNLHSIPAYQKDISVHSLDTLISSQNTSENPCNIQRSDKDNPSNPKDQLYQHSDKYMNSQNITNIKENTWYLNGSTKEKKSSLPQNRDTMTYTVDPPMTYSEYQERKRLNSVKPNTEDITDHDLSKQAHVITYQQSMNGSKSNKEETFLNKEIRYDTTSNRQCVKPLKHSATNVSTDINKNNSQHKYVNVENTNQGNISGSLLNSFGNLKDGLRKTDDNNGHVISYLKHSNSRIVSSKDAYETYNTLFQKENVGKSESYYSKNKYCLTPDKIQKLNNSTNKQTTHALEHAGLPKHPDDIISRYDSLEKNNINYVIQRPVETISSSLGLETSVLSQKNYMPYQSSISLNSSQYKAQSNSKKYSDKIETRPTDIWKSQYESLRCHEAFKQATKNKYCDNSNYSSTIESSYSNKDINDTKISDSIGQRSYFLAKDIQNNDYSKFPEDEGHFEYSQKNSQFNTLCYQNNTNHSKEKSLLSSKVALQTQKTTQILSNDLKSNDINISKHSNAHISSYSNSNSNSSIQGTPHILLQTNMHSFTKNSSKDEFNESTLAQLANQPLKRTNGYDVKDIQSNCSVSTSKTHSEVDNVYISNPPTMSQNSKLNEMTYSTPAYISENNNNIFSRQNKNLSFHSVDKSNHIAIESDASINHNNGQSIGKCFINQMLDKNFSTVTNQVSNKIISKEDNIYHNSVINNHVNNPNCFGDSLHKIIPNSSNSNKSIKCSSYHSLVNINPLIVSNKLDVSQPTMNELPNYVHLTRFNKFSNQET